MSFLLSIFALAITLITKRKVVYTSIAGRNFITIKNLFMYWVSKRLRKNIAVTMLLLSGVALPSGAQNNPQGITDRLYPMYIRAYNQRKSVESLPIADSLRTEAIKIGDHNAEVFAMSIPLLYEFYRPYNIRGFEKALKPMLDKAEEYGIYSLYYYAISMKVAYYTRSKHYIEASLFLDEQSRIAEKRGHKGGVLRLSRMLGVIQHFRGELSQAIGSYQKTIDGYKMTNRTSNISREYLSIAECYRIMCDFDRLIDTAEEALPYSISISDRNDVYMYLAYGYFMLGEDEKFAECYDYIQRHKPKLVNSYFIMKKAYLLAKRCMMVPTAWLSELLRRCATCR